MWISVSDAISASGRVQEPGILQEPVTAESLIREPDRNRDLNNS
jgi:hypothetical protein